MRRNVVLFPWLLVRVAGAEYTDLKRLELHTTKALIDELKKIDGEYEQIKNKISDQLYSSIAAEKDTQERNKLIALRRDIYNGRNITFDVKTSPLPAKIKDLITNYLFLTQQQELLKAEGEKRYELEIKTIRKSFIALLQNENFYNGTLLSRMTFL